jgi:MFS family permease
VTSPELRHSRIAILAYFFILGVAFTAWSARLPAIKQSLHLSDGRLGLALFAVPAGSVLTLALSGRIADRFGAERVLRIAGVLFPAALVPVALAGNLAELMAMLALFGALAGLLDVSMNACGARLELGYGRPIMSSLHAGYSIAGLGGAAIGGISAWLGASPLATFAVTAAALIVLGLLAAPHVFIPAVAPPGKDSSDPRRSPRQIATVIWVLGLLALCGQVGEGSAGDWSAVYLHVDLGTSAAAAAVALGAFSVTMAAGRVAGDRLAARFGPVRLVRASGLVAGLGLAGGLLVGTPAAAIVGFALLGLGLAGIFPQIVTAAARLDPGQAGRNIGRIAAVSYSGLLSGPVVIGAIASGVGLRNALLVPAALAVLVAAAAGVMKPRLARRPAQRSEQGVLRLHPAHGVVVQRDAADAPVGGQGTRLRPDLLGGEHALHRSQQRVPVQKLQISGQLLDAVNFAAPFDLHRDAHARAVPAHEVDRPDRGRVLAADQPPALAEHVELDREQLLQVRLHPVLDQAGVDAEVDRGIAHHVGKGDDQGLARLAGHRPQAGLLGEPARGRHPVQRLVRAAVGMHEHRAVRLDDEQAQGLGEVGGEPADVVDAAPRDDEPHVG